MCQDGTKIHVYEVPSLSAFYGDADTLCIFLATSLVKTYTQTKSVLEICILHHEYIEGIYSCNCVQVVFWHFCVFRFGIL